MTEDNYKCANCGGSIYTHDHYGSDPVSGITVYGCDGNLIWHMNYYPSQVFVPEIEVQDLKEEIAVLNAKYANLLLQTTGFLDSLVDPVESFVALLAGEVEEEDFYDGFYEEDEDLEDIWAYYEASRLALKEDAVDVLPPKDKS